MEAVSLHNSIKLRSVSDTSDFELDRLQNSRDDRKTLARCGSHRINSCAITKENMVVLSVS